MSNQGKIVKWRKGALIPFLMGALFCASNGKSCPLQISMERIQAIGAAVETFQHETGALPAARSIAELQSIVSPRLVIDLPRRDGWNNELHYITLETGGTGQKGEYWIGSSGGEPRFGGFLKYILKVGTHPSDIIFSNGKFVSIPKEAEITG